jgi:hypothetical protein
MIRVLILSIGDLEIMFDKWPLIRIAGFASILLYCIFTAISISFFPTPYSPLNNFLSQLGNSNLNPEGAIFYNVAVILAGLAGILFYIGLYQWYTKKTGNKLLLVSLAVGFINSLAIIMTGIYSESVNYAQHVFWSFLIFNTFVPILIIVNKTLLTFPEHTKAISYYGFIVAVIDIILLVAVTLMFMGYGIGIGAIMEWLSVFSYLGWVGILAYNAG